MASTDTPRFVRVDFRRFKAFDRFTLHLRHFNILVGPNDAGKSTVFGYFSYSRRRNAKGKHNETYESERTGQGRAGLRY